MAKYEKLIKEIQSGVQKLVLYDQLINEIRLNHDEICQRQFKQHNKVLQDFLIVNTKEPKTKWFMFLNKFLVLLYGHDNRHSKMGKGRGSVLLKLFYKIVPQLIIKYIKNNEVKYDNIQQCVLTVYNNEYQRYNQKNEEKIEFSKDKIIMKLYQTHLNKEMSQLKRIPLQPIANLNNLTKNNIKNILFFIVYTQARDYDEETLLQYYKALFIYCGADEKEVMKEYSLYLLEKKNLVSIFKYAISEQELQWIILTLYQLCIRVKRHKFELLAAINIVHKKTSNECQFKMSQVAQSLIHLLQDEYSQVFG